MRPRVFFFFLRPRVGLGLSLVYAPTASSPTPLSQHPPLQALALAYGRFDSIFVHGEPSRLYLSPLRILRVSLRGVWSEALGDKVRIVRSRGVPLDFCDHQAEDRCATVGAVREVRKAPHQCTVHLVYVGRLSYDKGVDDLLEAFEGALQRPRTVCDQVERQRATKAVRAHAHPAAASAGATASTWEPTLWLVGSGELEGMVRDFARRLDGRVRLIGQLPNGDIGCLLRSVDVYVSAATHETYGRSLVEALRCAVPVVAMEEGNMHVLHAANGLLAANRSQLSAHLAEVITDTALRRRLKRRASLDLSDALEAAVKRSGGSGGSETYTSAAHGSEASPSAEMLRAVLSAYNEKQSEAALSLAGSSSIHSYAWHPVWSVWLGVSLVLDAPRQAALALFATLTLTLAVAQRLKASRARRRRSRHQLASDTKVE